MNTAEFFKKLYSNCDRGFLSITLLPERKTLWFKASETQKAALKAENTGKNTNTFFGVGLRKEVLPHNLRGGDEDVFAITALWSDIDIQGKAHAQKDLPVSMDEAVNFVELLTLKPSIIVGSGNGLHAYWLLDTPYFIETREDRENVSAILQNWGKYVNTEAGKKGWKLDTVSDLARILRVPGTINHKTEEKHRCEIIKNEDFRYNIQKFTDGDFAVSKSIGKTKVEPSLCGDSEKIIEKCAFIKYCKEHASELPEPYWHAMITNLCLTKNGAEKIHELSKPYAKYSETETNEKIKRAIRENKPHTCEYIKNSLCFKCPRNCSVKAPVVLGTPSHRRQG